MSSFYIKVFMSVSVFLTVKAGPVNRDPFCEIFYSLTRKDSGQHLNNIVYRLPDSPIIPALQQCIKLSAQQHEAEEDLLPSLCDETLKLIERNCKNNPNFILQDLDVKGEQCSFYHDALQSVPDNNFIELGKSNGKPIPSVINTFLKNPVQNEYGRFSECKMICSPQGLEPICYLAVLLYVTENNLASKKANQNTMQDQQNILASGKGLNLDETETDPKVETKETEEQPPNQKLSGEESSTAVKELTPGASAEQQTPDINTNAKPEVQTDLVRRGESETAPEISKNPSVEKSATAQPNRPSNPPAETTHVDLTQNSTKMTSNVTDESKPAGELSPSVIDNSTGKSGVNKIPSVSSSTSTTSTSTTSSTTTTTTVSTTTAAAAVSVSVTTTTTASPSNLKDEKGAAKAEDTANIPAPATSAQTAENPSGSTNPQPDAVKNDKNEKANDNPDTNKNQQDDVADDTDLNRDEDGNLGPPETANKDGEESNVDPDADNAVLQDANELLDNGRSRPTSVFPKQENSHFFAYFLTVVIIIILVYLVVHNKQKILGLIVEGRGSQRRRSHSYRKLDTEGSKGSQMIF